MGQGNFKKLIFGFVLIVAAGFVFLAGFYYLVVKPEELAKENAAAQAEKLKASQQKIEQRAADIKKAQKEDESAVNMAVLIQEAEATYGPDEKSRKEGVLWVDGQSANLVVTLGALNGVTPGKKLAVYEGAQRLGNVVVDTSFDVISYVHPESALDLSAQDYYRVAVE